MRKFDALVKQKTTSLFGKYNAVGSYQKHYY